MNKPLPVIQESVEVLQQRLGSERDAQKRLRLQALYLIGSGQAQTRMVLAQVLAVHRQHLALENGGEQRIVEGL